MSRYICKMSFIPARVSLMHALIEVDESEACEMVAHLSELDDIKFMKWIQNRIDSNDQLIKKAVAICLMNQSKYPTTKINLYKA